MKVPHWWKHLSNISEESQKVSEINPEFEEKPIVESTLEISEDYHGGSELTFSIETETEASNSLDTETENENTETSYEKVPKDSEESRRPKDSLDGSEDQSESKGFRGSEEESREFEDSLDRTEDQDFSEGADEDTLSDSLDTETETETETERQHNKAFDPYKSVTTRKLRTLFQKFIESIAEVETKYEIPNGTQRLSMKQLMKRTLDKRSLKQCYADTIKESVILLIDTSASMEWWMDIVSKITTMALERKDIEIYEAPNGLITRPVKSWEQVNEYYDWHEYQEFHDEFIRNTRNRPIVYIGDFDGGDTPYELAKNNRVFWICNETRYKDTLEHDWCSHELAEYPESCRVLWAHNEHDLMRIFQSRR